jgi:hypothetical protein
MSRLVDLREVFKAFSPCLIVHCSFSTVTRISPKQASTFVFPLSKQHTVTISSCWSNTYCNRVFNSRRRWEKDVLDHATCATVAFSMATSISLALLGVIGEPRERPSAGHRGYIRPSSGYKRLTKSQIWMCEDVHQTSKFPKVLLGALTRQLLDV